MIYLYCLILGIEEGEGLASEDNASTIYMVGKIERAAAVHATIANLYVNDACGKKNKKKSRGSSLRWLKLPWLPQNSSQMSSVVLLVTYTARKESQD
jgi:hypothetical protein